MSSLNVIALISGGKDSLFSLLHCQQNGHKVVALANLHPAPDGGSEVPEDTDSFMYQTIGHNVIHLYSEALELPLYRRAIAGSALVTSRDYAVPEGTRDDQVEDETEDLVPLLQEVIRHHPGANAVSTGAILSSYQRTRVESVALRLGLTPLGYLWQYPVLPAPTSSPSIKVPEDRKSSNTGLLDDMAAAGCDARIIKVASAGLAERDLWRNVSSSDGVFRAKLVNSMAMFVDGDATGGGGGGLKAAVLGEGGEYETLALDGPRPLWKKSIMVEDDMKEIVESSGGVSFVRIKKASCVPKSITTEAVQGTVRTPALFDEPFSKMVTQLGSESKSTTLPQRRVARMPGPVRRTDLRGSNSRHISNIVARDLSLDAAEQMGDIVGQIRELVQSSGQAPDDIVFTTILLRSMSNFAVINTVYSELFSKPNPPARATVACGESLPLKVEVGVSLVVNTDSSAPRKGLHVQSRSYWAPANIGPYSQAITTPIRKGAAAELVYIAGQIPLDPASMAIARDMQGTVSPSIMETVLSLQHMCRISSVMSVDWFVSGIVYLSHASEDEVHQKVLLAAQAWNYLHDWAKGDPTNEDDDTDEDEPGPDAWDLRYGQYSHRGGHMSFGPQTTAKATQNSFKPDVSKVSSSFDTADDEKLLVPPFFAVEVAALPRGAQIEWQCLGLCLATDRVVLGLDEHKNGCTTHHVTVGDSNGPAYSTTSIPWGIEQSQLEAALKEIMEPLPARTVSSVTVYAATDAACGQILGSVANAMLVPCISVWSSAGQHLSAVLVIKHE